VAAGGGERVAVWGGRRCCWRNGLSLWWGKGRVVLVDELDVLLERCGAM